MKYLNALILLLSFFLISANSQADNKRTDLDNLRPFTVYKSPTCGCCQGWVDHMESADFSVRVRQPENLDNIKKMLGISPVYQACHTSVKSGYFFEGHIPADVIKHFLKEKPTNVAGLAVPGMPMGSPGMDVPGRYRPYEVLIVYKDGSSTPYAQVSIDGIAYLKDPS